MISDMGNGKGMYKTSCTQLHEAVQCKLWAYLQAQETQHTAAYSKELLYMGILYLCRHTLDAHKPYPGIYTCMYVYASTVYTFTQSLLWDSCMPQLSPGQYNMSIYLHSLMEPFA